MGRILTYKGLLADGGQDRILLTTKKGEVGYRIIKLELMPYDFGTATAEQESVVQVFKTEQSSVTQIIDFSDNRTLGAGIINNAANAYAYPTVLTTVFDNEIFNQDIYITHKNNHSDGAPVNYYLELVAMKLREIEAMVTTLKDIRNSQ